ncbi:hypothetical protein BC827DRAFT_355945 [Russula dissimulans]|nr:hypothetical protein BC827DRAFT_355945 [Russula dissimulans]
MLYKPLVSLAMVFAATSSVAASATPIRRGGYPAPPTQPIPQSQCNTESQQCCNTYTSGLNPIAKTLIAEFHLDVNPTAGIGMSCNPIVGSNRCVNEPLCCQHINQNGAINIGCAPLNIS